ncbi:hypothetical protein Dsin_008998 [Dipteronia sinensis]|uniref:DUF4283 domain-containing protein n=1 Tax=Dipteronia sinensis TaxID=43782 RepID=A0AAE0AQ83_9ROSI|nr:hypothetical protein Dsin_008998 [Dipteronia sinensis]
MFLGWNSTYLMLESAVKLRKAFERLGEEDDHYVNYFKDNENDQKWIAPPNFDDWDNAKICMNGITDFMVVRVGVQRKPMDMFSFGVGSGPSDDLEFGKLKTTDKVDSFWGMKQQFSSFSLAFLATFFLYHPILMVDSASSMDSSPKHSSLPCLGSNKPSTPYFFVLPSGSTMENPPFYSNVSSFSIFPSLLEASETSNKSLSNGAGLGCQNEETTAGHEAINNGDGFSLEHEGLPVMDALQSPKMVGNSVNKLKKTKESCVHKTCGGKNGVLEGSKMVASSKNVIKTSSVAVILDNNGVLEGSKMVAPSKNVIGKKKGTKDQGDSSEKFADTLRPTMLQQHARFSSLGNAQKLASKERACSSINVECQHVQLGGVASFRYSGVQQCKGIPTTSPLVINDSNKAEAQPKCPSPIIPEIAHTIMRNSELHHKKGQQIQLDVVSSSRNSKLHHEEDDEACSNVLDSGPWLFAGRMVILKKWHPRLILTKETCSKIPVWVKLFNIPHEYRNEEGLSHIASAVGKPLYADSLTESMKRISYARVCIEIDATCELVDSFDLFMGDNLGPNLGESVEILVEYQWKPKICTECKTFGHSITTSPKLKPLHPPSVTDFDPKPKKE